MFQFVCTIFRRTFDRGQPFFNSLLRRAMVYSAELGYDPDEWEECPPSEHFLIFGFFTRFLLSVGAIGFTAFFFWLINAHKQWGKMDRSSEKELPETAEERVFAEAAIKVQKIVPQAQKKILTEEDAEALKDWEREVRRLEEKRLAEVEDKTIGGDSEVMDLITSESKLIEHLLPTEEDISMSTETKDSTIREQHLRKTTATPPSTPGAGNATKMLDISYQELAENLQRKLLNELRDMSGQETPEQVADSLQERHHGDIEAAINEMRNQGASPYQAQHMKQQLEHQIEEAVWQYNQQRQVTRDDDFYKVSPQDVGETVCTPTAVEAEFTAHPVGAHFTIPSVVIEGDRNLPRTSTDSDEGFEKIVYADSAQSPQQQIHSQPQGQVHVESSETGADVVVTLDLRTRQSDIRKLGKSEEERLNELFKAYEDVPQAPTEVTRDYPQQTPRRTVPEPGTVPASAVHGSPHADGDFVRIPSESYELALAGGVDPLQRGYEVHQAPQHSAPQSPPSAQTPQTPTVETFYRDPAHLGPVQIEDDPKRIVEAEMYIHDAIEYVNNQANVGAPAQPAAFVIEEEMLDSDRGKPRLLSNDRTSQMVRTADVFDKMEHQLDEVDDTMTYAPEIQSVEIPPDQMSENSENLLDYFDKVAGEHILPEGYTHQYALLHHEDRAGQADAPVQPQEYRSQFESHEQQRPQFETEPTPIAIHLQHQQQSAPQPPTTWSGTVGQVVMQPASSMSSVHSGTSEGQSGKLKDSSLLSILGVTSLQEMLLALTSLDGLSSAMRKAGLESTNLIFGIDYTASNKYQGENCFDGRSLHTIQPGLENPYQQVIKIMGKTLAPFATSNYIPVFGFGDVKTSDWSVFKVKPEGECVDLDDVLRVYNEITPTVALSGPTNFAPLIYQAIAICEKAQDYHILVIIADGQVTNEKATRRAIVQACQYPLSIIVVGVGDGPWDMMKVFDESLPKRPWDNFHFVELHEILRETRMGEDGELAFAVQSLLEIPDQYQTCVKLGLVRRSRSASKIVQT
uniref:VWFA domain-containing protein n=1 Tax=Steinernema glaseri TaxID=37863 RepID=A0A1I8AX48_9BILA